MFISFEWTLAEVVAGLAQDEDCPSGKDEEYLPVYADRRCNLITPCAQHETNLRPTTV